ncbi:MAG: hypothetical protein ACTSQE_12780 [Candidatus Heimdallarchaeaceae archaeon]
MQYNFDEVIDRKGSNSVKWDFLDLFFDDKELLPLWVADMDFRVPQPVIEALEKVAKHGVFGYSSHKTAEYAKAVKDWMKRRHNWNIDEEWIVYSPGVVPAIAFIVR